MTPHPRPDPVGASFWRWLSGDNRIQSDTRRSCPNSQLKVALPENQSSNGALHSAERVIFRSHRYCDCCAATVRFDQVYVKWSYPILKCASCGMGKADVPAGFDVGKIYDEAYFRGGRKDGYADYPLAAPVLRAEFRRVLKHILSYVDGGRLLELGCAYGYFLEEAARFFQCEGIEICQEAARSCRQRGLQVTHADLTPEILSHRGPYDAVVMLDVIEHLPSPAHTIAMLRARLRVGGTLILTTGDWGSALARVSGKSWRLMTPPQHLHFFTIESLRRLLARNRLRVHSVTHQWKLVPLGLALYQISSRLRLSGRAPAWLSSIGIPLNLFDAVTVVAKAI